MPTSTTGGLPIPLDTDAVAQGADAVRDLGNALQAHETLFYSAAQGALIGTAATAGAKKIVKSGSHAGPIVGAGGGITITFPTGAFPNGLTGFTATVGDAAGNAAFCRVASAGYALGSVLVQVYSPAGAVIAAGTNVRVNYNAVGW